MIARRTLFFLSPCQSQSPLTLPYLLPLPPLIALFQLPLLLPWINPRRVSTCLAPSPRCRSHSSFPSPLLPCPLVPFSWTKFCLAANALPTFPLHTRPILLASFISPAFSYSLISPHSSFGLLFASLQFLLLLFCLLQSRPILLA